MLSNLIKILKIQFKAQKTSDMEKQIKKE